MKHKIKKSKTRKKYSKRVSKKVTKRQKKELKRKKKNSRKNKIKKGGDATTTIGLAAAAIGMGTAAMYFRRNIDPTDDDKLGRKYSRSSSRNVPFPKNNKHSNGTYLNDDDKKNIATTLLNLHSKINKENGSADENEEQIYVLACDTLMEHAWFPLEKDTNGKIVVKNKHQSEYDELLKTATQSSVHSGKSSHNNQLENNEYEKLSKEEKDKIRRKIRHIFKKIQKNKNVTDDEYEFLEELYEKYQQQSEFPLQGNIEKVEIGAEETKGEEEDEKPSFKDLIVRGIKQDKIYYQP